MNDFIKLYRKILGSKVFANPVALKIWIWCLCKATHKERFVPVKIGRGHMTVKLLRGQFIFGRSKAEKELNIDGSTIYKWMQKFTNASPPMIRIESNNQYSIVTICNYEEYQGLNNHNVTSKEQPKKTSIHSEYQCIENSNVTTKEHRQEEEVYKEEINNIINNIENEEYLKNLTYNDILNAATQAREIGKTNDVEWEERIKKKIKIHAV